SRAVSQPTPSRRLDAPCDAPSNRPGHQDQGEAAMDPDEILDLPASMDRRRATKVLERALFEVNKVVVGQDRMTERLFVCVLARGHCLLEGAPGLAKPLAAETLARTVGGDFARLQFTPDLVPADIV